MPKTATKTKTYEAALIVMGKTYRGKGETVAEAIGQIDLQRAKGMGILTVSRGNKSHEKVLPPVAVNRLFHSYGLMHEIALKNISLMFSDI